MSNHFDPTPVLQAGGAAGWGWDTLVVSTRTETKAFPRSQAQGLALGGMGN